MCATQATLNRLTQPKNSYRASTVIISAFCQGTGTAYEVQWLFQGSEEVTFSQTTHEKQTAVYASFCGEKEGFQSTLRPHLIGIFNVKVTLNSSLILSILTYQDQDSKWTRRGYIEKYCQPFWEMAAAEVKGQICNGPIAKNFL